MSNIIEKLGIKKIELFSTTDSEGCCRFNYKKVRELEQQRNELLEALIDFKSDAEGYGVDTDPELVDLVESHLLNFTNLIEKVTDKSWEEIKKL